MLKSLFLTGWFPKKKWLTSEYILVPITLEMWGFSSKQFLGQYNLKRKTSGQKGLNLMMMCNNSHVGWNHVRTLDNVWRVFGTDRAARPWRHTWRLWLREVITTSINKHSYSTAINERLQTKRDISAIRVSECFQTHLLLWKLWRH